MTTTSLGTTAMVVRAQDTLSYAMAHNRAPFVEEISISHDGPAQPGCTLLVQLEDSDGPIGAPYRQIVDLAGGSTTRLSTPPVRLDAAALLQVDEQRPGRLVARLESTGIVMAETAVDVQVLAAKQWVSEPFPLALEMLAAYVLPNDPAVQRLLAEVSTVLERQTGSPSLEGYQSGPERVDEIAKALYEAAQQWTIRYAEPPASWSDRGQKVRTPGDVLETHVGTCLDTTVLLAAALEQAGIHPLLWVVQGHAFLGYWRQPVSLNSTAVTDVRDVLNYVDTGAMRLVETTMVTSSDAPATFSTAQDQPYRRWLSDDLDEVVGIVDVRTARTNRILPLPARRQTSQGVEIHEYRPAEHSSSLTLPAPQGRGDADRDEAAAPPRVQQWKNALLDLTLRNRLINFTEKAGLSLRVPQDGLPDLEDLVHAQAVNLVAQDDLDGVHEMRGTRSGFDLDEEHLHRMLADRSAVFAQLTSATYASRMRSLAYKARTIAEETGANNLYLTLGTLVWELDGRELRSPLILVPVQLTTTSRGRVYRLSLDEAGGSTPNYCLLEKLRQSLGLRLPGLENLVEDDYGVDVKGTLTSVRETLLEKGLPFRVEESATVSILQFAKFRLWKDLDEHWQQLMSNSLVRHLVETPTEQFVDPVEPTQEVDLDEIDALCPIPADASQVEAVNEAVRGRTFVLEGPPGTGKSQTITNLLTRAIASGQRVLFVAEKRAALDVVAARLATVGMAPFCLDLHDKGSKPAAVRAQVRSALEHQVAVDVEGLRADVDELTTSRRNLARYASRLHEKNRAGHSFYSARSTLLARGQDETVLPVPRALLAETPERHELLRAALADLPDAADAVTPRADHPWSFVTATSVDEVPAILSAGRRVDASFSALPRSGSLQGVLARFQSPQELQTLARFVGEQPTSLEVLDQTRSTAWHESTAALTRDVAAFVAAAHPGLEKTTPAALDLPLADIHARAVAAASSGFFGRKKRLRAVLADLEPTVRPGQEIKPKEVPAVTEALLQVLGAVRGLAARAGDVAGVEVPTTWNPLTEAGAGLLEGQVAWLTWAGEQVHASADDQDFTSALRSLVSSGGRVAADVAPELHEAASSLSDLLRAAGPDATAEWQCWLGDRGARERWEETASSRGIEDDAGSALRRWVMFLNALVPLADAGAGEAWRLLRVGEVEADEAAAAWSRGLAQVSLVERAQSTGLESFDAVKHDRTVTRFASSAARVRDHMHSEVPRQVLENRPFHAAAGRGHVGALQRELSRQRGGMGIRALLETYGDLITQVMPCVLVSPDSVSRFFPVGGATFDLVVFDEASQVRVADAVGAMGRARSVVVVGDSKQMPPTSFGESSGEAQQDDDPLADLAVADQESILGEAADARVPRLWLTWHYRSQEESLIAFSNAHYYGDKLSSFPPPIPAEVAEAHGLGVSLRRVDGTFLRSGAGRQLRTNPVEAQAIVEEIQRRFDGSPHRVPSVGVVTFNQQQRTLIESLLRDTEDARLIEALDGTGGEGLFVKNLENVQGDERDVILFSTAFSVNEKGILPLNFGPLSRAGGERRLNVAVTRARRQVIIFSSFDPGQLRAAETTSVGIQHLRAYLDMAASGAASMPEQQARATDGVDRHRDDVAASLRERGIVVRTKVGLSDFKIDLTLARPEEPDRPLVAVLLDGEGWARRRTVGDRDGLPVQVLGRLLRWPAVERVWLPTWLDRPEAVLQQLETALEDAFANPEPDVPPAPTPPATAPALPSTEESPLARAQDSPTAVEVTDQPMPHETAWRPWQQRRFGGREVLDALPEPRAQAVVLGAVREILQAEGPVQHDRLAKLAASAFDLTRVRGDRAASIVAVAPRSHTVIRSDADFAWPTDLDPSTWLGYQRPEEGQARPVDQVSLRELGNAMVDLCDVSAGVDEDELLRETLHVFGGRRLTPAITDRLREAVALALLDNRLESRPNGLLTVVTATGGR